MRIAARVRGQATLAIWPVAMEQGDHGQQRHWSKEYRNAMDCCGDDSGAIVRSGSPVPAGPSSVLVVDSLVVNVERGQAKRNGRLLSLQPRQFELLVYFMRNAGRVIGKSTLAQAVWKDETATWTNVIAVHVCGLRKQLERSGSPTILHTVRGKGYRLGEQAGASL